MDENMIASLDNFDEVWGRVCSAGRKAGIPERRRDEAAVLRGFITDEVCCAAFYTALARKNKSAAGKLGALAREENEHLRQLQTEYFLLTGDTYIPGESCPLVCSSLDSLRRAYSSELACAESYRREGRLCGNERLAALYEQHAKDEEEHAQIIREMIAQLLSL